ncbi:MAG: Calx-beta domain-containing protein [Planctomycetota bacterium]
MVPALKAGDPPNPQWNMEKVRAADTWQVYDGSPKSVVVVEDYGVDYRHEDFGGSALTQGQFWDYGKIFAPDGINFEFSRKGRDDYDYPVNPARKITLDPVWNATTLPAAGQYFGNIGAGIIGAKTNNNLGVAGVNWDVQLYSSKVVVNDTTSHDIIAKRANRIVQYLRMGYVDQNLAGWGQNNPNPQPIRAVSFGYSTATDYGDIFHFYDPVSENAPDMAGHYDFVALGQGIANTPGYDATWGILVTVPTGDYGQTWPTKYYDDGSWGYWKPWTTWDPAYPRGAGYSSGNPDNVIAVAATDIDDKPWAGNAKNPIDIYAPGVNIWSIGEQGSGYDNSSGTRQAQAHVAGAIALLYDVAQQHGFKPTYHQVREAIIEGGDDIGLAKPRLNIVNSIKYLSLFAGEDLTQRPVPNSARVTITGGIGNEGDSGVSEAKFKLQLSQKIDAPVTIGVMIEDGTATAADGDYVSPNSTRTVNVTIPAQAQEATFAIKVNGDRRVESNESFRARIVSMPGNIKLVPGGDLDTWTIVNDDAPPFVSLVTARAIEGSAAQSGWARVMANLSKPSPLPVTVQFSVVNDTALSGKDFDTPASTVITFPANVTRVPLDIRMRGNSLPEPDRSFQVRIDSVINGTVAMGGTSATVTIVDDDRILVTVEPAMRSAVVGATMTMSFTVTLKRAPTASDGPLSVNYATSDGIGAAGAAGGVDYSAASGTLVFNVGEASKKIEVTVLARRVGQRYPKSFSLTLSDVSAAGWFANGASSQSVVGRIS